MEEKNNLNVTKVELDILCACSNEESYDANVRLFHFLQRTIDSFYSKECDKLNKAGYYATSESIKDKLFDLQKVHQALSTFIKGSPQSIFGYMKDLLDSGDGVSVCATAAIFRDLFNIVEEDIYDESFDPQTLIFNIYLIYANTRYHNNFKLLDCLNPLVGPIEVDDVELERRKQFLDLLISRYSSLRPTQVYDDTLFKVFSNLHKKEFPYSCDLKEAIETLDLLDRISHDKISSFDWIPLSKYILERSFSTKSEQFYYFDNFNFERFKFFNENIRKCISQPLLRDEVASRLEEMNIPWHQIVVEDILTSLFDSDTLVELDNKLKVLEIANREGKFATLMSSKEVLAVLESDECKEQIGGNIISYNNNFQNLVSKPDDILERATYLYSNLVNSSIDYGDILANSHTIEEANSEVHKAVISNDDFFLQRKKVKAMKSKN